MPKKTGSSRRCDASTPTCAIVGDLGWRPGRPGSVEAQPRPWHRPNERPPAAIAQPGMRLAFDMRRKCRRQPRLADARLAGNQHNTSFAAFCLLPAPLEQLDFLVAPDERRLPRAQGLEPAHLAAFAQHPPGALRLGKAGKLLRPEVF